MVNSVLGILEGQMARHGRDNNVTIDGRDMKLADWFVRENLNLNPADAQRYFASNFTANSVDNFLAQAGGITTIYKGIQLHVAGAEVVPFSASSRVRLLEILSDPLVSSLLLILGIYLVIFGISAPGHGAEIAGIIILLLAIVGLGFNVDPIALLLFIRSEEHTSELQSLTNLVCRLLLEKKKKNNKYKRKNTNTNIEAKDKI